MIFKGILINKLEYMEPPLPDFMIEFTYNNNLYLKPIETTTISNFSNYDNNLSIISEKNKKKIKDSIFKKFENKTKYETAISEKIRSNKHILLSITVVVTSIYSFIKKDILMEILNYLIEKAVDNSDLLKLLKINEEYNVTKSNTYFYFLYFKFDNNLEHIDIRKWCIYNENFINLIVKKWKVDISKHELEHLELNIDEKKYLISLKKCEYCHNLEKDNELYKNIIKILKCEVNNEYDIVYKSSNINESENNMSLELFVSNKRDHNLNTCGSYSIFKYKYYF